jgi:chorismate mutase
MVNKNIIKIRKSLDKLDNSLLVIIKKRIKLVDIVIKNKKFKKEIVDKKRISVILKNISIKSKDKKIDPLITKKIWQSMIRAFIDYEFRNFKKTK